jgi:hypothetical protein
MQNIQVYSAHPNGNTSRSFSHSRLITGFVTRLARRVPLVEQELLTIPEHLSSPPIFSGFRVTRSLVLYVQKYTNFEILAGALHLLEHGNRKSP